MQTTRYPGEDNASLLSQIDSKAYRDRRSRSAVTLSALKGVFTREKRWGVSRLLPGALAILILNLSLSGAVFGQSPTCSVPDLASGSDRGSSSSDNITNDRTPTFTGTATANSTIEVRSDLAGSLGTALASANGDWAFAVPGGRALADGTHTISARATDAAGNSGPWSPGLSVLIDTQVPATPGDRSPADGMWTNNKRPTFSWTTPTDPGGSGVREYRIQLSGPSSRDYYTALTTYTPTALDDGDYTWRLYATDVAGNPGSGNPAPWSESWHFAIDTVPPSFTGCPSNVTVYTGAGRTSCDQVATWTAPTASDNRALASLTSNKSPGAIFSVGETTVTYTAKDMAGNTTTCNFKVTVVDNTPPGIAGCPSDVTVYTGAGRTSCDQVATWTAPTASDNCTLASLTPSKSPGAVFSVGATTVTYAARDMAGNTTTCNFKVTVVDNTPPIARCQNITVQLDASGNASITAAQVDNGSSDPCGVASLSLDKTSFTCANVGPNTVTLTATDANGNSSTCHATVTVQDNVAPTIACPANLTLCSDVGVDYATGVALGAPTTSDNCGVQSVTSNEPGVFPVGTTTVVWTATDIHGNAETCAQTVTVLASPRANITPDPAQVYANVKLQMDGNPTGGSGTYTAHTWAGIGATHLSSANVEDPTFTADIPGSYPLTYTVTDSNGGVGYSEIVVQVINATPVAQYQSQATCKNAMLSVALTATDAQLDPLDPALHPLTFAIVSAPSHGTLSGNLGMVNYAAPHTASATVTYTPDPDFLGTDTFTFIATDPFGEFGIATVSAAVQECGQAVGGGGGTSVFASVVINEVAWGGTGASPQDQWIELRNNTDDLIDTTGWQLRWQRKHPVTPEEEQWVIVSLSGTIAANGYYLLERLHDETVSDVTANLIYDTTPPYSLEFSTLGDVIELVNAEGDVVDTANADHPERDGWIAGSGPDGMPTAGTMERIDPLGPDTDSNWATNRHLIVNGQDASADILAATAAMENENTLIGTQSRATPQSVRVGEQVTIAVELPVVASSADGLPQVTLARLSAAAGGGGAALEPSAQAAALSASRIGGMYELSLDTSTLAPGTYGLWLSMGDGVFHGLVFEVVGG